MYEALLEEGYSVSYPSVINTVNSIERKKREAYIRQEYAPGDIVEFDFGVVKVKMDDGNIKEFQLAVFTAAMTDRLTHKAYVVNMNGNSYRIKETKAWLNANFHSGFCI